MKKIILVLLAVFLAEIAPPAQAQEWYDNEPDFYAALFGGANFLQNATTDGNCSTYRTGYVISGAIGYHWCYGLRMEGEYAYRRNSIDKIRLFGWGASKNGHFQSSSWMANLFWDLPLPALGCALYNLQSYIGTGVGYDFQKIHASNSQVNFNQKWHHFSWQVMAGLTYPLFWNGEAALEYKFHQGGSNFKNHSLSIGFIYKFDLSR